ncbi:MAG: class I SAM-dependent methyltransferase [Anaerolineaceae bacterium]|nr:MAG: class I SAM-dependent methyltransferase [Anaerolineaceae bacterium]
MTTHFTDPNYLKTNQYRDSSNLDARAVVHQRFSTNPYGWFHWVFDRLSMLPENARILEVGCGPGYLWKECGQPIPASWNITLSDLSPGMVDAAWRNLVVTGRNFKFEQIDAQSIPYPDETFDAVIANHMLYHVPDRRKALSEMRRVLKTGGRLFAGTLGRNHMREMWDQLEGVATITRETITSAFTLENGTAQLQEFFPRVEVFCYEDNLRVTDVAALVAYVRSMTSTAEFSEEQFQAIEREFTEVMKTNGEIFITKDSGMFVASK